MGRRGPAPQPTKLRKLRGNPGRRPLPQGEPQPRATKWPPAPPAWLSTEAKREWRRVGKELHRLGLFTVVDRGAFAIYCQAWADWRAAVEFLEAEGSTYVLRDKDGKVKYVQQFPQVAIARAAAQQVRAFAAEFGLTPSARTRVRPPVAGDDEETPSSKLGKFRLMRGGKR